MSSLRSRSSKISKILLQGFTELNHRETENTWYDRDRKTVDLKCPNAKTASLNYSIYEDVISSFPFFSQFQYYSAPKAGKLR